MKIRLLNLTLLILLILLTLATTPAGATIDCPNNLVTNPSFEQIEDGHPTGWHGAAHATANTGWLTWLPDGTAYGYHLGGPPITQTVTITANQAYSLTFYSGSHQPGVQTVTLQSFAADATLLATDTHTITVDVDNERAFGGPYTLSLPPNPDAATATITINHNGVDWAKLDALCLAATRHPSNDGGTEEQLRYPTYLPKLTG